MKRSQHGNISKWCKEARTVQVGVEGHKQTKRAIVGARHVQVQRTQVGISKCKLMQRTSRHKGQGPNTPIGNNSSL